MNVYYEKYIKAKIKEFNGLVNTKFLSGKTPNEVCITLVQPI